MARPVNDLSGKKFGRLRVLRRLPPHVGDHGAKWICLCRCGRKKVIPSDCLSAGYTKSCGCYRRECSRKRAIKNPPGLRHGHARRKPGKTRTYSTWSSMLNRCNNPKNKGFHRYGGRGIFVAPQFRRFEGFLAYLGEKPKGMTLDRIDNNGPYAPGNVRWATVGTQNCNTRRNRRLTLNGQTLTLKEWCDRLNISQNTIQWRLKAWPLERTLTTKGKATHVS